MIKTHKHISKVLGHWFRNYCTIPPPRRMSSIVWMDLEMTGLNYKHDRIMEIACLITDNNLNIIAEGPNLIINQPQMLLDGMDEWCTSTHTKTGLLERCKSSTLYEEEAQEKLLEFLQSNIKQNECPLAGNSIYMDRLFLKEYMPKIDNYLHYRIIDVSTCKELCKRWNSKIFSKAPVKLCVHRGLSDIKESIEELKYYRNFMF